MLIMPAVIKICADAGYHDVKISLAEGRIPCAVAVMRKKLKMRHFNADDGGDKKRILED